MEGEYKEPEPVDTAGLPELPKGWCWASVDDFVATIEAGASFKCDERPPDATEIGVLKVSAVTWGEYDESESKTCLVAERINEDLFVRPGDFLFSRANTIDLVGACVLVRDVTRRIMLSDKILRFAVVPGMEEWLLQALRSPLGRSDIERLSTGNQLSMRNIGQERLRQVRVALPPAAELTRVYAALATGLQAVAVLRQIATEARERLPDLESVVLAKAFRGELVAQDPNDEPAAATLAQLERSP